MVQKELSLEEKRFLAEAKLEFLAEFCPEYFKHEHEMTPEEAEQEIEEERKYLLNFMSPEQAEKRCERLRKKQPERLEQVKERNKERKQKHEELMSFLSTSKAE
jgi:hypothetical protein